MVYFIYARFVLNVIGEKGVDSIIVSLWEICGSKSEYSMFIISKMY